MPSGGILPIVTEFPTTTQTEKRLEEAKKAKRARQFSAAGLCALVTFAMLLAICSWQYNSQLLAIPSAMGTVTNVTTLECPKFSGGGISLFVFYNFTATSDGRSYRGSEQLLICKNDIDLKRTANLYRVGDPIKVYWINDDPRQNSLDKENSREMQGLIMAISFLSFFTLATGVSLACYVL